MAYKRGADRLDFPEMQAASASIAMIRRHPVAMSAFTVAVFMQQSEQALKCAARLGAESG